MPAWRTSVPFVMAAGLGLVGRLVAGPTFGAVLWVAFVTPWVLHSAQSVSQVRFRAVLAAFGVSAAGCLPLIGMADALTLWRLVLIISLWNGLVLNLRQAVEGYAGRDVGQCLVVVGWISWWAAPIVFSGQLWMTLWIERSPLVMLMGQAPSLGDWTHQAVAYRSLTRLGQDAAFAVPSASLGLATSLGTVATSYVLLLGSHALKRKFYVEQANSVGTPV